MTGLSPDRLGDLLRRAQSVRVLVIGDLMLDRYVSGHVDRVSPEAPVPVVRVERESSALGGAGNVAANATALGAACAVVGLVGDDAAGREVVQALWSHGVQSEGVVRSVARPTTVKTRILARHHQIVRFDHEVDEAASPDDAEALAELVRELAAGCDVLVVQDYDKGVMAPGVLAAIGAEAERGLPVVVDPKRRSFFEYGGATVFKPNERELREALGEAVRPDDASWLDAIRERLGCEHLLVTLGDRGMALRSPGGSVRLPAAAKSVYDVSGAGDTVSAVLGVLWAAGATPVEAAQVANLAAGVGVGKAGVQTVSADEILEQLRVPKAGRELDGPIPGERRP